MPPKEDSKRNKGEKTFLSVVFSQEGGYTDWRFQLFFRSFPAKSEQYLTRLSKLQLRNKEIQCPVT